MKKDEFIAVGVKQYTERRGGNPYDANLFVNRVGQIMRDFGEGFAVFVGEQLVWFAGDVGGARNEARNQVASGHDKASVTVKRIKV